MPRGIVFRLIGSGLPLMTSERAHVLCGILQSVGWGTYVCLRRILFIVYETYLVLTRTVLNVGETLLK